MHCSTGLLKPLFQHSGRHRTLDQLGGYALWILPRRSGPWNLLARRSHHQGLSRAHTVVCGHLCLRVFRFLRFRGRSEKELSCHFPRLVWMDVTEATVWFSTRIEGCFRVFSDYTNLARRTRLFAVFSCD